MTDPRPIVIERWMNATPATVFDYFADPERLVTWQATAADVEPHVDGTFRLVIAGSAVARGRYIEMDPPHRLVMTWGWEGNDLLPPEASTVAVVLTAHRGGTAVTITVTGVPDTEIPSQQEGWIHYLDRLQIAVTGGDPGPDPWAPPPPTNEAKQPLETRLE